MLPSFSRDADVVEVGVDEAGRGSLIGDVFAGAVIWNPELDDPLAKQIKDSKKVSRKKREMLRYYIEDNAVDFAVASRSAQRIDQVNVLRATQEAMHAALDSLQVDFDLIVVDGDFFRPYYSVTHNARKRHECVVGGDGAYTSVAAASILAKVYHDEHIRELVRENPCLEKYKLLDNMGYGTPAHIDALRADGATPWHRMSFGVCASCRVD